jgi:hypothetical protein
MRRTIATLAALAAIHGGAAYSETSTITDPPRTVPERDPQWSPIGLGCGVIMLGLGFGLNYLCERAARPPVWHPDRWPPGEVPSNVRDCQNVAKYGFGGLGIACAFL